MKKTFFYTVTILVLSSCATLFNQSTKTIFIRTSTPANVIVNKDTLKTFQDKIPIWVRRQQKDLKIKVFNDSVNKEVEIKYKNSFAYWLNAYPPYWIGFLIDKNNPKRYTYPTKLYFDMSDTTNNYFIYSPRKKGQIDLHVSMPYINSFLLRPDNENCNKSKTSFYGLTLGLDYYHSSTQFINISVSGVSDFPFPVPIPNVSWYYIESISSNYLSISNNHKIKNFLIGYGLSYVRNTWDIMYTDLYFDFEIEPQNRESVKKSNNAIGFVFPVYYMPSDNFFIGAVYRPTLFRFSTVNPFNYEHLISFDFGWKIRLIKSIK